MMKKHVKYFFLTLFFIGIILSCKKDNNHPEPVLSDITGQWEFILTPDQVYNDTTLIKGHRASDFPVYSSVIETITLYQDQTDILGFAGPYKLTGTVNRNKVTLNVYDHSDGEYKPDIPLGDMAKISEMLLTMDAFYMMKGTGTYVPYSIYPDITHNTYTVEARKINDIKLTKEGLNTLKSGLAVSGWENDICKVIFSITSWVIATLTDGVVRTMSSDCWLHKDGGGYYAFGHEGPGSLFPILTQSIYYPYEWSACQVREYGFDITIGSENISYEALKNSIINSPPVQDLIQKLGFTGIPQLEQALDDFYNEFGGFGITVCYDTHTNNSGLYVNHIKGDNNAAINSTLIQSMKAAFESIAGTVYVYAGSTIHDDWHLRRSPAFICNSPIVICYVIGTHNVSYN